MPQFDIELWKERATRRFQKACARGRKTNSYMRDLSSIEKLAAVIAWCEQRGIVVTFSKSPNGEYLHEERSITINGRLSPETQLFILLHECGHALVGERQRKQRYGNGYSAEADPYAKRTILYRVDVIDEELEAWHRGLKLAKRLGITVNVDRYNRVRAGYVKTYLQWAARPKRIRKKVSNDDKQQGTSEPP